MNNGIREQASEKYDTLALVPTDVEYHRRSHRRGDQIANQLCTRKGFVEILVSRLRFSDIFHINDLSLTNVRGTLRRSNRPGTDSPLRSAVAVALPRDPQRVCHKARGAREPG